MMVKKLSRESRIRRLSLVWTVSLVAGALLAGTLLHYATLTNQTWPRALAALCSFLYVGGFAVFFVRYQQALDERVAQLNLGASWLGFIALNLTAVACLFLELFGVGPIRFSAIDLFLMAQGFYLLAYFVRSVRSR